MGYRIDRCYCFGRTFAELKDVAEETGERTVAGLQEHVLFGERCMLCHAYVRRMLRTGETVFSGIVTGRCRRYDRSAASIRSCGTSLQTAGIAATS